MLSVSPQTQYTSLPFAPGVNTIPFRDRESAGRWLAKQAQKYAGDGLVVLGIPRGGIIVGAEIARALHAPLDVFVVRRIRWGDEQAQTIGAMASGGVCVLDQEVLHTQADAAEKISAAVSQVRDEVSDLERRYRQGRPALNVQGRTVLLVDDGAASGGSLRAAVAALRPQSPAAIVVATPVSSPEAAAHLAREAENFICPCVPDPFFAIGLAYERYPDIVDDDVCRAMAEAEADAYLET